MYRERSTKCKFSRHEKQIVQAYLSPIVTYIIISSQLFYIQHNTVARLFLNCVDRDSHLQPAAFCHHYHHRHDHRLHRHWHRHILLIRLIHRHLFSLICTPFIFTFCVDCPFRATVISACYIWYYTHQNKRSGGSDAVQWHTVIFSGIWANNKADRQHSGWDGCRMKKI